MDSGKARLLAAVGCAGACRCMHFAPVPWTQARRRRRLGQHVQARTLCTNAIDAGKVAEQA